MFGLPMLSLRPEPMGGKFGFHGGWWETLSFRMTFLPQPTFLSRFQTEFGRGWDRRIRVRPTSFTV